MSCSRTCAAASNSLLGGGLSDLVDRFKQNGQGEVADSWVRQGPNQQVTPQQLEQAIGPDVLAALSQQTGLSREELLSRLSRNLPDAVDKYTPEGRNSRRGGTGAFVTLRRRLRASIASLTFADVA